MRGTRHNGRGYKGSKNGYNPKHDDRDYDIDEEQAKREKENVYWNYYDGQYYGNEKENKRSFSDAEKQFYEENFKEIWKKQNEKNEQSGHKKRNKSFDEWRSLKRYCPEESYLQIGNMDEKNTPDKKTFYSIAMDYLKWEDEWNKNHGNPFTRLDYAIHNDEGIPQIHYRKVWSYTDENGDLQIGQEKALEKAGVALPHPEKKNSRYNNRKIEFDKMCRNKFIEIAESYGVHIEKEPVKDTKHNMSKEEYLRRKKTVEQRESEADQRDKHLDQREADLDKREENLRDNQRFNDIFVELMKVTHFDAVSPSVYEVAFKECGESAIHDFEEQEAKKAPVKPFESEKVKEVEEYQRKRQNGLKTAPGRPRNVSKGTSSRYEDTAAKIRRETEAAIAEFKKQKSDKQKDDGPGY